MLVTNATRCHERTSGARRDVVREDDLRRGRAERGLKEKKKPALPGSLPSPPQTGHALPSGIRLPSSLLRALSSSTLLSGSQRNRPSRTEDEAGDNSHPGPGHPAEGQMPGACALTLLEQPRLPGRHAGEPAGAACRTQASADYRKEASTEDGGDEEGPVSQVQSDFET